MYNNRLKVLPLLILMLSLIFGCKDDTVNEPPPANSAITGSVLFLDGTIGASAPIELQHSSNNSRITVNADENGIYEFSELTAGDYIVRFKSTSYNIHTYEREVTLTANENLEVDIYILYNMLDELKAVQKNRDLFLIKFQPDGAKIGDNHIYVDYFSGTYFGDYNNLYTLNCDVYKIPDTLDWFAPDSLFTPEYIRLNFEYITSAEETLNNNIHEIRFYDDDKVKILSNPFNGFAFLKPSDDDRELKIPCVDFNNNDFGLRISY